MAYDSAADRRDEQVKQPWKLAEREQFLGRLRAEQCTRLLEIGAGTGQDSAFFAGHGLEVVATDMSPEMVARCRDKGLDARFGRAEEGSAGWDDHVPARFFSFRTDGQLMHYASQSFEIVDFHVVETESEHRFQSLTLRRRAT